MARATTSASNVAKSDRAPPPRTTRTNPPHGARACGSPPPPSPAPTRPGRGHRRPRSESRTRSLQLVRDVMPGRAPDAGHQPHGERQDRRGQPRLRVVQPCGDEVPDQFLALEGQFAQRVAGIDPAHLQAQTAAGSEEVRVAVEPDLHAIGQAQPMPLQQRAQLEADVGEEVDREVARTPSSSSVNEK